MFKDAVIDDLENSFFNLDELADVHNINGKDVPCLLESTDIRPYTASFSIHARNMQYTSEFINEGRAVLIIRATDLVPKPKITAKISIDGNRWNITDVNEEVGVYTLRIERLM